MLTRNQYAALLLGRVVRVVLSVVLIAGVVLVFVIVGDFIHGCIQALQALSPLRH